MGLLGVWGLGIGKVQAGYAPLFLGCKHPEVAGPLWATRPGLRLVLLRFCFSLSTVVGFPLPLSKTSCFPLLYKRVLSLSLSLSLALSLCLSLLLPRALPAPLTERIPTQRVPAPSAEDRILPGPGSHPPVPARLDDRGGDREFPLGHGQLRRRSRFLPVLAGVVRGGGCPWQPSGAHPRPEFTRDFQDDVVPEGRPHDPPSAAAVNIVCSDHA